MISVAWVTQIKGATRVERQTDKANGGHRN